MLLKSFYSLVTLIIFCVVVSDVRADIHAVTTNGVLNSLTSNGVLNGLTSNGVLNGLTSNFLIPNGYLYNGVLNGLANNSLIGNGVLNGILIGGNFTDLFFQNETWNGLGYEIPNVVINGTQNLTGLVPPASILSGLTLDYIKYILSSVEVPQNSTEILPYLVTCALAPQDTFDFIINNVSHHYTGFLGLASTYYRLPLTREQEEILSACLFAHVNALGKHVFISLRNIPYVPATLEEMTDHRVYEGAFFGNLFGNDFIAYTCTGDKEVDALKNSPTRFLRLCTTNMTCNFKSVGNCSDACSNYTSNYGYSQCKGLDGRDYVPMNVYLESNDVTTNSQTFSLSTIIGIGVALGIVFVFFLITIVFIIVNRHKLFKRNNEK